MKGKLHYPPRQGWHPDSATPSQQQMPVVVIAGVCSSYADEKNGQLIALFAASYEAPFGEYLITPGEIFVKNDDGSSTVTCEITPIERSKE